MMMNGLISPAIIIAVWFTMNPLQDRTASAFKVTDLAKTAVTPPTSTPPTPSITATQVDFQDSQPVSITKMEGSKYRVRIFLRNDESDEATLKFSAFLQDDQLTTITRMGTVSSGSANLAANSLADFEIVFDIGGASLPAVGYLQVVADVGHGRKTAVKYRPIKVVPGAISWLAQSLYEVSFLCALLVGMAGLRASKVPAKHRMGNPSWNFSDSWGTNIAFGGALLTAILGSSALPDQTHYLSKTAYICLSVSFAALIAIAPSIYGLSRTPVDVDGSGTLVYQGFVGFFALSSGIVLWGALGQIATVGLLFGELKHSHEMGLFITIALLIVLGCVACLLIAYAFRALKRIPEIAKRIVQEHAQMRQERVPVLQDGAPESGVVEQIGESRPSLPGWSVL